MDLPVGRLINEQLGVFVVTYTQKGRNTRLLLSFFLFLSTILQPKNNNNKYSPCHSWIFVECISLYAYGEATSAIYTLLSISYVCVLSCLPLCLAILSTIMQAYA